jgi:hypothetical protein
MKRKISGLTLPRQNQLFPLFILFHQQKKQRERGIKEIKVIRGNSMKQRKV